MVISTGQPGIVLAVATLCFWLEGYAVFNPRWARQAVYYGLVPLFTIVVILRRSPRDFGIRLGEPRIWLFHVIVTIVVSTPILWTAAQDPSIIRFYSKTSFDLVHASWTMAILLMGWKFIFRGFILFGVGEKHGPIAIFIQMAPYTILHFGKAGLEALACIPVGIYFGFIAWRGRSYLPLVLIHLYINLTLKLIVHRSLP